MNTTSRGNLLEAAVGDLLEAEIVAGRFLFAADSCKLFRKKGYFSRDRQSSIVFDLSIEVFLAGSTHYSIVLLIECKNYSHPVPVDDVEEFFQKVQQVGAANAKAIVFSTAAFQSGAMAFAQSKGIGLARYFSSVNFQWELYRSASCATHLPVLEEQLLLQALSQNDYVSDVFDLYFLSSKRCTHSLTQFVVDIASTVLPQAQLKRATRRLSVQNEVPFFDKPMLEELASSVLASIEHVAGPVSLSDICEVERQQRGLVVEMCDTSNPAALGSISFFPTKIQLFPSNAPNAARERFTLAHELCHHLLGHGKYMRREYCYARDFEGEAPQSQPPEITRMEFQANRLAGCILMPLRNFRDEFFAAAEASDIRWRGRESLYVDKQPCNLQIYFAVVDRLAARFKVSRMAANVRLEAMGLLRDARSTRVRSTASCALDGLSAAIESVALNET